MTGFYLIDTETLTGVGYVKSKAAATRKVQESKNRIRAVRADADWFFHGGQLYPTPSYIKRRISN